MHRNILALTLAAALAAPAFAEPEKAEPKATPVHQETVKKAPAQINDPNWQPCDYSSDSDVDGCE